MMGCLRAIVVQVGCGVLLVAAAVLAFIYRDRVGDAWRVLRGLPPRGALVWTVPERGGAARARTALERITRSGGPAFVDITAAEIASLVDESLDQAPGRVFDSVALALGPGEVMVRGSLDVTGMPRSLLGPLAGVIGPREPLLIGGGLEADTAGRVLWRITALTVRDFPFPRATIPAIVRQLRIPGAADGAVPLPGVMGAGDVRVTAAGVRVYRSSPR
jgi:hypothetical protein